jgi:hypothetical protein
MVVGPAEGVVLRLVPAGADAERQSSPAGVVEGDGHLRQQRRVAEAQAQHEAADADALGGRAQQRQRGPALQRAGFRPVGEPQDDVIEDPE